MDISLIVISMDETNWLIMTFLMGLLAFKIGLPPMVGFLLIGFIFKANGLESTHALREIADLGVTLMLFTIGLKLDLKSLLRVQIWGVASIHMLGSIVVYSLLFFVLASMGFSSLANLDLSTALLIAFSLSFSSTVFAVKVLEGKNEMGALYAKIAIGILIVQDIFAVIFLTASTGKIPSVWALALLALPFVRPLLFKIMDHVKHGELLVLYSLILAIGGAGLFEMVGMKADLGALIFGVMLAQHPKALEVSKVLYNFKDLFLVGFFVNIGLSGDPGPENIILAAILSVFVIAKVFFFFWLLAKTYLRTRTSFLTSVSLANYSEFGLIVGAIGVNNGWMSSDWLITIAISLAITFVIASPLNAKAHLLHARYAIQLRSWQSKKRLDDELPIDISGSHILVFGMGRIGKGVYDDLSQQFAHQVTGIEFDTVLYKKYHAQDTKIIYADVMDKDFWNKIDLSQISYVFLCLSFFEKNIFTARQLKEKGYKGKLAAIAKYDDEIDPLKEEGVEAVYNFYSEAGVGFAEHVRSALMREDESLKKSSDVKIEL